jgi:hypothetical protein
MISCETSAIVLNMEKPIKLSSFEKLAIRKQTKGLYRTMLASVNALKDKFPDRKLESEYAEMALENRPHWKKVDLSTQ